MSAVRAVANDALRVSVVIPTYNAAAFLPEAVASVRAQTCAPAEIIVVDDASADDSVRVAEGLGLTVVRQPVNRGPSAARNVAVARATGELIAFLDADDAWLPWHLALCVGALRERPEVAIACTATADYQAPVPARPELPPVDVPDDPLVTLISDPFIPQAAAVVRRAAIDEAGGYDEQRRYAEDYDLWLRIAAAHRVARVGAAGVRRREHAGQASRALRRMVESGLSLRLRTLAVVQAGADPGRTAAAAAAVRQALEADLHAAWYMRDIDAFSYLLSVAGGVPGGAAVRRRWALRRRVAWHAWHALRDAKQFALRGVGGRGARTTGPVD